MNLVYTILDKSSGMMIFALDEAYRYLYFNAPHALDMQNLWGADIRLGESMLDHIPDGPDFQDAKKNLEKAVNGTEFSVLEEFIDQRDNHKFYEKRYVPLEKPKGVVVYVSDITERRRNELQIKDREAFLNAIIRDAGEGIVVFEKASSKIILSNKAMVRLLGQSGDIIAENYFSEIFSTKEYQQLEAFLKKLKKTDKSPPIQTRCLRSDASEVEVQLLMSCLHIDKRKFVIAFIQDISKLAEKNQKIQEFQKLFEVSKDMFSISNPHGYFTQVNPRWTQITGYSEQELTSRPLLDFVHPDDKNRTNKEREDLFTVKSNSIRFENRYITKTGETIWLEWNSTTLEESGKNYSVARDITSFKERELYQQKITSSLYHLSAYKYSDINDIDTFIFLILEEVAKTLELDRLSFWAYDEKRTKITCTHLIEEESIKSQPNSELLRQDYPVYFDAISSARTLSAVDVEKDKRTSEFVGNYFDKYSIRSMLDVQVENRSNQIGVLCAEQIRKQEEWSFDQQSYLIAVSEILASAFDAHEKHEFIGALSESEALFRAFTNTMPAIIYIKDIEGRHLYANNAQLDYLGTTLKEYTDSTSHDFFPKDYADELVKEDKKCIARKSVLEKEFPDPKNTGKWFVEYKFPIFHQQRVHRIGGIVVDITERKQLEIRQEKINKQLNLAIDTASLGIWEFREKSGELTWNHVMYKIYGTGREGFDNTVPGWQRFVHRDDADRVLQEFQRIRDIGETEPFRYRIITANGEIKHILASGVRVLTASEEVLLIGVNMDISDQVKKEEDLLRQKSMQQILTRISIDYINTPLDENEEVIQVSLEEMGLVVNADRAYIFHYDHDRKVLSNTHEFVAEGITPEIENLQDIPVRLLPEIYEAHQQGKTYQIEDVSKLKKPSQKKFFEAQEIKNLITVPMMTNQKTIGFVGFDSVKKIRKYTQEEVNLLKVYAELLVNIKRRAENQRILNQSLSKTISQNNRLKDFSFITSHNIRSSVANLLGLTSLIEEDPQNKEYIRMLIATTKGLDQTIRNLNELVSIEKEQITTREINIRNLVEKEVIVHKRMMEEKSIEILQDIPVDITIKSIPVYWESIIFNLVSNAITHGASEKAKPIEITASKQKGLFTFSVKDYGKGIPQDVQKEEPFKLGSRLHGESKGQGMGLFLVKNHVEMVGASIEIDSRPDTGTKITIYLNE